VGIRDRAGTVTAAEHHADHDGHVGLAPALPPSLATRLATAHSQQPGSQARPAISSVHQGSVPLRQSLPDNRSLPPLPGKPAATPNGTSSIKPAPASPHMITPQAAHNGSPLSAFAHGGPTSNVPKASTPLTRPIEPQPPRLAARPPLQPPAIRPPSRPMPPPVAAFHPAPPPMVHRQPPPVAAFRPPPAPTYHAPPPVVHAAPPVVHAAPPVARAAPPPVARAAPAPPPGKQH